MGRNVLTSSLQSAYFSIVFQIFCRCLTFGINAFIVRRIGRDVLGIMNVRLLLLESTLLFLSREAINRAALSSTTQNKTKCSWAQLINQIWLTVPLCAVLSLPCMYIWLEMLSSVDEKFWHQYKFGVFAISFSCIIELCAEVPLFVSQVFCFVKLKIVLDTLHILIRSIVFITIVLLNEEVVIYAFGIAQLASALTLIVGRYLFFYFYILKLRKNVHSSEKNENKILQESFKDMEDFPFETIKEMVPGFLSNEDGYFNSELQVLTLSFVKQSVFKQILTEGEKYVMSVSPVLTFSEQATYDVVNNLGSLAARFVFRPIEDASYFYFTQTIARDVEIHEQNKSKITEAGEVLKIICKVITSIGLLAFTFGQSYAGPVLLMYGGASFVAGGLPETLLKWHSLAIFFLAINGITEGYMFATNTSRDIDKYNYYMAIFSVVFLILSYILTNIFGPVGFIVANCINMIFRISYSTRFIRKQYKLLDVKPLEGIVPGKLFAGSLLIFGSICKLSEKTILKSSTFNHFLVGLVCFIIVVLFWIIENRNLAKQLFNKFSVKLKIN